MLNLFFSHPTPCLHHNSLGSSPSQSPSKPGSGAGASGNGGAATAAATAAAAAQAAAPVPAAGAAAAADPPAPVRVLFVQGVGATALAWHTQVAALLARARALGRRLEAACFDNRGVGRSSSPRERRCYSTAVMARDAAALLDHLGWTDRVDGGGGGGGGVHIIAFSMGCQISQKLASSPAMAGRVRSLTLVGAAAGGWRCLPRTLHAIRHSLRVLTARSPVARARADLRLHFTKATLHSASLSSAASDASSAATAAAALAAVAAAGGDFWPAAAAGSTDGGSSAGDGCSTSTTGGGSAVVRASPPASRSPGGKGKLQQHPQHPQQQQQQQQPQQRRRLKEDLIEEYVAHSQTTPPQAQHVSVARVPPLPPLFLSRGALLGLGLPTPRG